MSNNDKQDTVSQSNNRDYEIQAEGSLGLLALGAKGLDAWRKKITEAKSESAQSSQDSNIPNEEK